MKRLALLLVAVLAACSPAAEPEKPTITVYADSALTEAFTKIGSDFEASQGMRVKFLFGASQALEKQLGAHVDVFASASQDTMKYTAKVFAGNRLVLALPQGNPKNVKVFESFRPGAGQRSYAMCVEEAPCGAAARSALKRAPGGGMPGPKAVGQDVKETLAKLTSGEVDSAFVYASDVKASPGLIAVPMRDEPDKAAQRFPIAVVSGSPEATKFYDYVFTERAQAALTDAGFDLP
ncbi:hypothetical protein UK23_46020 [Lentzea aerocolonigenes]|uniref:Molybdate-binding protein n=1 Tax=Lentzea aerocolonigenes TaxID=68170 RepID=A0A0F0GH34_LENAE|nr:molybdate ABC transporter substrate-binding protein [Lentzea aerocolonigenes]KJK33455.1 hypothetical protein UK23_46020 [Lentzea aerocolonigenes]